MFCRKGVLTNCAKFTGKQLRQSLFFNKVADQVCNFIKKEPLAQVLSCEFSQISKNIFFTEHLRAIQLCSNTSFLSYFLFIFAENTNIKPRFLFWAGGQQVLLCGLINYFLICKEGFSYL